MGSRKQILVVEDDANIAEALGIRLSSAGYQVHFAREAQGAVDAMREFGPELALLDVSLAGSEDGIGVAQRLREIGGGVSPQVLFLTASLRQDLHERAAAIAGARLLHKPYDSRQLLSTVSELIGRIEPPSRVEPKSLG